LPSVIEIESTKLFHDEKIEVKAQDESKSKWSQTFAMLQSFILRIRPIMKNY